VDPKTVKRKVLVQEAGGFDEQRAARVPVAKNTDVSQTLVAHRVDATKAKITAKRLVIEARAVGYLGSARNFRRLVAAEKKKWRAANGRQRRPAIWTPGDTVVIDWGTLPGTGVHVFCAVLAWSRIRFVRYARDETAATTFAMLAECFQTLVGYAKRDVLTPDGDVDLASRNEDAVDWCAERNSVGHSEICAIPMIASPLRPRCCGRCLRSGPGSAGPRSARSTSCPQSGSPRPATRSPSILVGAGVEAVTNDGVVRIYQIDTSESVAVHDQLGPGESSILDKHCPTPRKAPSRGPRARTDAEHRFLALRFCHSAISATTRSVILEMVSRGTSAPYTSAMSASPVIKPAARLLFFVEGPDATVAVARELLWHVTVGDGTLSYRLRPTAGGST